MQRNRRPLVHTSNAGRGGDAGGIVSAEMPQKHRPLDILRYNLVDAETLAAGGAAASFPKSMYQTSFVDGNTISATVKALHDSDHRAVTSCTPSYKERLQRTPPFAPSPAPASRPQSIPMTPGPGASSIDDSTYRHDFPRTAHSDGKDVPAAGRLLPRDPIDTAHRGATEASLARSSYVAYGSTAYQARMANVCKHLEEVRQRSEHARATSVGTPFTATSLHRASYAVSGAVDPPVRCNPERAQTVALLAEKADPTYYNMAFTSTQRGDFSVVARLQGTAGGSKAAARRGLPPSTTNVPASRSSWLCGTQDALAEERDRLTNEARSGRISVPVGARSASSLSQQLSNMSVELVDPPACRAQTSCEIIPQKIPYPHATVHVPVAQRTGPGVLDRRCADAMAHGGRPAGMSHRAVDAPRPTMHCCSGIFNEPIATASHVVGTAGSDDGRLRTTSRMSYRPFQFHR